MGILKSFSAVLLRPYIELWRSNKRSVGRIREHLAVFRENVTVMRSQANDALATERDEPKSSKEAFETLYKKNGWTEPALEARSKELNRAKWICRGMVWALICASFASFVCFPSLGGITCAACLMAGALAYLQKVFSISLYATQLSERDLVTAKAYFSRPGFFVHLLVR